jgi:hypothetical protein
MVVSYVRDGSNRSLNMAHAIPAQKIAGVICSNVACSEGWRTLAAAPEFGRKPALTSHIARHATLHMTSAAVVITSPARLYKVMTS